VAKKFDNEADTGFFPLDSVVETSEFFEYGRRPYQVIKMWQYAASRVYRIRLLDQTEEVVFVKLLANECEEQTARHQELIAKEYRILKDLREQPWCRDEHTVIEPLECVRAKHALITREAGGERLDHVLLNSIFLNSRYYDRVLRAMHNSGAWLKAFHEATNQHSEGSAIDRYISDEVQEIMDNLATLRPLRGWEELCESCAEYVTNAFERVDRAELRISLCHGDFGPGNILVKRHGEIVVLDFSDSRPGVILKDLACFSQALTNVQVRRPWHRGQRVAKMKESLLESFFQRDDDLRDVFAVFWVGSLIERASFCSSLLGRPGLNVVGRWQRRQLLAGYGRQLVALTQPRR
jgi:serine/threonine protein kinase